MKVSLSWLKELVKHNLRPQELADKLSLHSIGVKTVTPDWIELDLTYNRGDLLSLRGVAREVAAITGLNIKFHDAPKLDTDLPKTTVKIEDEELSPVQCSAKIEGLKVGLSSPDWVKKLEDCGIRSVNNVVDVTNLIMLEYGQPLHAFDAQTVKGETINVRCAKKDEQLTTLDGKIRKLSTQDIVLADTDKPLDVAGVMGSKDTEVKQSTHTILLSASMFNPVIVRKTAERLGLHSEASKRFQHGLTKTNLLQALSAAIKMYESLGGKLTAINLVGDFEEKLKTIKLTQKKINSLLGVDIPTKKVETSLTSLGFQTRSGGSNSWKVTVPYWRLDIAIEEDLVEEVARMYGYEKIEGKKLEGKSPKPLDESLQNFIHDLKVKLADAGLTEVQTYSFFSTQVISNFKFQISNLVKIANPISSETEYLRDWLTPNLVEVVAKNTRYGYMDIGIFEVGKVYLTRRAVKKKSSLPDEKYFLAIALINGSDNPIQELCQIYHGVRLTHPRGVQIKERPGLPNKEEYHKLFHPTRFISFTLGGKDIGGIAELHPRIVNRFGVDKRVAILEIDLETIIAT